ncbi:MAG: primosomal protein N', partial [Blastocatellia bacterium]
FGLVTVEAIKTEPIARPKLRKAVRLLSEDVPEDLTPQQKQVLDALRLAGGEMYFTDLLDAAKTGASPVQTLARRQVLKIYTCEQLRDPLLGDSWGIEPEVTLSVEQSAVFNRLSEAVAADSYQTFLLRGVTGSGKTEIYIRLMEKVLAAGRSSLLLIPEIALTPIFSRRLRGKFGSNVAILHSSLSTGERFDEWRRIRSGEAKIAIGTRSAIFAPLERPALIIVDEEHDASYRQSEAPHYNARDLAVVRARNADRIAVLGSATPSLESFHNARTGKYEYLELKSRIGGRPMAMAELIDMRSVFRRFGKDPVISPALASAIEETHRRGEQTIVLLNRRGYSSFVLCRTCGEMIKCTNCDITLTYHKSAQRLSCHYCGFYREVPANCPSCESEYIYFVGEGTERVEEMLAARFPKIRIARVDRDSVRRKGELDRILLAFGRREYDLLIGTQMLAKGHDFHSVTLVGVISVDTGLGLPDFRAAERTFQLLTQVAGRAGRGNLQGSVLIQTYYPEHYALKASVKQDYEQFYEREIRFRREMGYPPFTHLISVIASNKDVQVADKTARLFRQALERANTEKICRVLGPAPAALSRLKGAYRRQILIKSPNRRKLRAVIEEALEIAPTLGCERRFLEIEIDPIDLM